MEMSESERPQTVILGAGFGGLWAAKALDDAPADVILLDRNNYHAFWPLLYQVAAAELEPGHIANPVRAILRRLPNVDFRLAEVVEVDLAARVVQTADAAVAYDYLIVATGSVSRFFGIPGAAEHAFGLKTMEDGIRLRNHILHCFELARKEADPARRRQLLTFVVVGGGPTGVEYAGALAELFQGPLAKDHPHLDIEEVRVILLEALDRLLSAMPDKLGRYAWQRLQQMGVDIRLASVVSEVNPGCVRLEDGMEIPARTVIWTAGVGGSDVARRSGFPIRANGTVLVLPTLQLPDHPNVYVVGDLAAFEDEEGGYLPMVAPVAIQQGERAARNIKRQLAGQDPVPFHYNDKGSMATIGRNAAVAHLAGRAFTGFLAWLIWLIVHLVQLIGFRNRLVVLINWAWNYLFYERVVRLILPAEAESSKEAPMSLHAGRNE
jgi:NADH dehydrogenase